MALTVASLLVVGQTSSGGPGLTIWLTAGMLLSSLASATAIWINLRRSQNRDERVDLHEAIDRIDDELKECRTQMKEKVRELAAQRERNAALADENLRLLRELVGCRRDGV